jgi:DNA-binding ferritin-like protein
MKTITAQLLRISIKSGQPFRSSAPLRISQRCSFPRKIGARFVTASIECWQIQWSLALYKKSHRQTSGATFYSLHLLFDKHTEQLEIIDTVAERIQILGGVSIALAPDVAEMTELIAQTRQLSPRAALSEDDGTNDVLVSDVLRSNEMQVWFLSEHLVHVPLVDTN